MVTTRNSHQDTVKSNAEASLLLDKLRSVLSSTRHMTSSYGDILKYVHEKPPCYNKCKKSTDSKCANYTNRLKGELMVNNAITKRGKAFVF
jgi:hypothetical protein